MNKELVREFIQSICQADVWCRGCRKALDCEKSVVATAQNSSVAYCRGCFERSIKPNLAKLSQEKLEQLEFYHWEQEQDV